jgi:hypothetical protein
MKTIRKQIRVSSLILALIIMLQSCTVYKSTNVSLEQASKNEVKTKVVTSSNEKLKFKFIENKEGTYYGVKKVKGNIVKMPLNEQNIKKVVLKDKTMSLILTIAIPLVLILGGLAIGGSAVSNTEYTWNIPL